MTVNDTAKKPGRIRKTIGIGAAALALVFGAAACGGEGSESHDGAESGAEHNAAVISNESGTESGVEGAEGTGGEGEESATQYGINDTYDETRNGARLILSYDAATNSFNGTVENTTTAALSQVRVEVHLSNGIELGPTTPTDLAPGQVMDVTLQASDEPFTTYGAHPEVGADGGESGGEHGGENGEGGESHGSETGNG